MRLISCKGWLQTRQSSGNRREKRARGAVRTTEGIEAAIAVRLLLLEKTHLREFLLYPKWRTDEKCGSSVHELPEGVSCGPLYKPLTYFAGIGSTILSGGRVMGS